MLGALTTQILTLQGTHPPVAQLNLFVLGVPLGTMCHAAALISILIGGLRFVRNQRAIVAGRICAGGWEFLVMGGLIGLVRSQQIKTRIVPVLMTWTDNLCLPWSIDSQRSSLTIKKGENLEHTW